MPYTDELKEEKLLLDAADDPEKLAQLRQEQRVEKRAGEKKRSLPKGRSGQSCS